MRTSFMTSCAISALVALSACSTSPSAPSGPSQPQGPSQSSMMAPLVLRLRGPDPLPAAGDIRVDVEIQVNEPIRAPVTLQVQIPPGVVLVSGMPTEVLQLSQAGTLVRTFVVRTNAPLQLPVIVTANARDPNGAFGLHAERRFPAQAEPMIQPASRPPVPRPAMPPR